MAKIMIFSTGNSTELYIGPDKVVQGITKVTFAAESGKPATMELTCDVNALKIEDCNAIEETKKKVLGYMKKFSE